MYGFGFIEGATQLPCLRVAAGLNTTTRRAGIGTSLPVFGLRPTQCPFLGTKNEQRIARTVGYFDKTKAFIRIELFYPLCAT